MKNQLRLLPRQWSLSENRSYYTNKRRFCEQNTRSCCLPALCHSLGAYIVRCLSGNETFLRNVSTKTVFFHTSLFLFYNPVTYCEVNIKLIKWNCIAMLRAKVTPFIAAPRRPPYWIIHCCYQIMSRERKLVQRLVNGLFWSRLSNLITIPDCLLLFRSQFLASQQIFFFQIPSFPHPLHGFSVVLPLFSFTVLERFLNILTSC